MDVISFFYCTMMKKKFKRQKKKIGSFSLYLCLSQSLALGTVDVYPYLSSRSLLLMKELGQKNEPFSLEQDVVNSNVISLSVCFTCLYHSHLSLGVQTDPGPTRSETSSTRVSRAAVRSWCQICLAVDGERWTRRCTVADHVCLCCIYFR